MYNHLRLPQTRFPEPSQPGHAPCIPSLLKLCENTVSFCYYGSTSHTSVNIPRNFIKACSQLIECLGNSAVCSLSSCQRWFENILKLFALLTVLLAAMGIAASPLGVTSPFFPCPISDSPIQGKPFGCAKVFSWIISNLFISPSATLNLVINCSSFLVFRHWRLRARTSGWRVMAAFRNEPSFPFPGEKRITGSHPNKSNNQILFKDFAKRKVSNTKWYNWSNCSGPLKSGAGGSLLPEFQADFEHCENLQLSVQKHLHISFYEKLRSCKACKLSICCIWTVSQSLKNSSSLVYMNHT